MTLRSGIALAALLLGAPAWAQDAAGQSAADLAATFERQLGATRGLVLAPSGGAAAEAPAATDPAAATPAAEPAATYVELDRADQINLQISFDFDSAALRADQAPKLDALCEAMRGVDIGLFRIVGHTDASGSAGYNESLSLLRAQEVRRHLVTECGIAAERLEAVGVGEEFPFDADDPDADVNRRVEFQALG